MPITHARLAIPLMFFGSLVALPAAADTSFFSTGDPDGRMATVSRPDTAGKFEIESADDFILTHSTSITDATFTGLLSGGAAIGDIGEVRVEIYRVFPADSDTGRTPNVPTRTNSPSDVALDSRDTASGNLSFTISDLGSFSAANSVQPGGIHPKPGQTTGGDGAVTGEEVMFDVTFTTPFVLPADHYFFVPQVEVTTADGEFLWLSAPKPITGGTGPFMPDLQSWTRDAALDPDWLRVGTDIVGGATPPTFNGAFSLSGSPVPEPSTWAIMLIGFAGLGYAGWRRARRAGAATA